MPLDKPKAPFSLPKLPYDDSALEPVVSAKKIYFHHAKHQKAYIDNLNRLIAGTPYEQMDLEEIVKFPRQIDVIPRKGVRHRVRAARDDAYRRPLVLWGQLDRLRVVLGLDNRGAIAANHHIHDRRRGRSDC